MAVLCDVMTCFGSIGGINTSCDATGEQGPVVGDTPFRLSNMHAKKESIVSFVNQRPFQRVRRKTARGQLGTLGKTAIKTSGN